MHRERPRGIQARRHRHFAAGNGRAADRPGVHRRQEGSHAARGNAQRRLQADGDRLYRAPLGPDRAGRRTRRGSEGVFALGLVAILHLAVHHLIASSTGGSVSSLPPQDNFSEYQPRVVKPRNLALGIERIGFFALNHRALCAIVFILLSVVAAIGFTRVKVDDSLSQLFRSDTDEFRTYEEVTRRFPSNEFDVLIVIEGDKWLERSSLEKLRELAIEVQLIDGTRGLISIFSAREPPEQGSIPPPLFPNPLPEGADYQALIKRVTSNEIIKGKMLSDDGKLTLMVLALEPTSTAPDKLGPTIGAIREAVKTNLEGTGLKAELSGVPVMQLEIRNAIQSDRLVYNTLGFAVGCLIAIIFFRRPSFMIIAAAPPLLAILMALGVLGWLGFSLNMFLNVMTPLIMVISFSDSLQLTFAARDRLLA